MFIHNDLYVSKINITYTDFPKSNIEIISISLRIECLSKIDSMYSVDHRGCVIIPPTSPVLVVAMYKSSCLENSDVVFLTINQHYFRYTLANTLY